jgi:uncharacterized protein DUF3105
MSWEIMLPRRRKSQGTKKPDPVTRGLPDLAGGRLGSSPVLGQGPAHEKFAVCERLPRQGALVPSPAVPRKSRTPAPPRRVQAPKARREERDPAERRRLLLLVAAAVLGIAVLAGGVALIAMAASGPSAADALRDAGCTSQTFPAQETTHITERDEDFDYNSDPPTSGPHHPTQPPFDIYSEPVEQYRLIHNLEHGGIVIQYGDDVPESQITAIRDWYLDDPNGIVVAPYPKLGAQIALGAWTADEDESGQPTNQRGHLAKCPRFDEEAFDAFVDEYAFRGPEAFEKEDLKPGLAG